MPQVSSQVIGWVALFAFQVWSGVGQVIHLLSQCIGQVTTLPLLLQLSVWSHFSFQSWPMRIFSSQCWSAQT